MKPAEFLQSVKGLLARVAVEEAGFQTSETVLLLALLTIICLAVSKAHGAAVATRLAHITKSL